MNFTQRFFGATVIGILTLALAPTASAQRMGGTNLTVTIPVRSALVVNTSTASTPTLSSGSTSFSYFLRSSRSAGVGSIALKITSAPSAAGNSATSQSVTYTCTASVGNACAGMQNATTTTNATPIVSFGSDAYSPLAGARGAINWSLPKTAGNQNVIATFIISSI